MRQSVIKKPINFAVAWVVIASAVAVFLMLLTILYGRAQVTAIGQQGRIAVYEANSYYGVHWLAIPGTKKPIVLPVASVYKSLNGVWLLINKAQPISTGYVPADLVTPNVAVAKNNDDPTVQVHTQLEEPLNNLFAAASTSSHALTLRSAYRASSTQQNYYSQAVVGGTTDYVAMPGQSEHQTGLAIDVNNVSPNCNGCDIDNATAAWLKDNAYKYGFIVRYQDGKESITGYNAEPWHLRYVGILLATKLYESGLTLEEFMSLVTAHKR